MKKIWIALVVIAMLALLCTLGMITVFAEEDGQESCLHENPQGLYDNDEHWVACADCGEEWREAHSFRLAALDEERHAYKCECGRVVYDSIGSHAWALAQGEDHLYCSECGVTTTACVYDQVTYYNDAYHTYGCVCGNSDPNGLVEAHVVDMTTLQYDDVAHWYGCPCGYGAQDVSEHVWGEAWVTDGTNHWKECVDCGAKNALAAHSGGTATCQVDAVCAECGTSYEADTYTHVSDALVFSKNNTHHSAVYACCGEVAVALERHDWENSVCKDCGYACNHDVVINGATHTFVSTGNDTHIAVCKNCGKVTVESEGHDWDVAGKCTVCEYQCEHVEYEKVSNDASTHKEWCKVCHSIQTSEEAHKWENGKCTDCLYECAHKDAEETSWMKWSNDGIAHKFTCEKCGWEDTTKAGNCTGGTATCVAKAVCETCSGEYGSVDSTNHVDETWTIEADGHSASCDATKGGCGVTTVAKAAHTWVDGVCSNENCQYACLHGGDQTEEANADTDTHDVTCDICQKLLVDDGAHSWKVDAEDSSKSKCEVCAAACDHVELSVSIDQVAPGATSLKVFSNEVVEGVWKHKATCSRCGHVDQEGECAVGESGKAATCVAPAECGTCKLAYGDRVADAHDWDALTGECKREGCDGVCQHSAFNITDDQDADNANNQHKTTCKTCGHEAMADCYGNDGTATCMVKAVCEGCDAAYGALDPDKHDGACLANLVISQIPNGTEDHEISHYLKYPCQQVGADPVLVKEAHDWDEGICSKCGYICTSPNLTVIDDQIDNNQHQKKCETCGHIIMVNCSGGQATCLKEAVCNDCGAEYGDYSDTHDDACERTVGIIPNNVHQHNVYYTCKKDQDGNPVPTLEDHYIDPAHGVCECGWHVTARQEEEQSEE